MIFGFSQDVVVFAAAATGVPDADARDYARIIAFIRTLGEDALCWNSATPPYRFVVAREHARPLQKQLAVWFRASAAAKGKSARSVDAAAGAATVERMGLRPELKALRTGELILFTVTFCANPANDLTCPPSYINILKSDPALRTDAAVLKCCDATIAEFVRYLAGRAIDTTSTFLLIDAPRK